MELLCDTGERSGATENTGELESGASGAVHQSGAGERGTFRWSGGHLSRRLLHSMREEATPWLMMGEVEPPMGPPQAHSLGDEKGFPAVEQVPNLGRTCLI